MLKTLSFLICFFPLAGLAQQNLLFLQSDTLYITERTGGTGIDSLDWYNTGNFVLSPGGPWNNPFGTNGSDYLDIVSYMQSQVQLRQPLRSKFIALPHLGFSYSFGSKSLQYLRAEYQQSFRGNTHLNVDYSRNSTGGETGFMRNSSFANDAFRFLVDHHGKRYANLVYLNFIKATRGLSGGIRTDTLIETYGLEFTPVFKVNATSTMRSLQLGSQHHISFSADSLVKHGLVYKNKWSLRNRVYLENDSIFGIYDNVYIDSFSTRDQYQLARIDNAGGYFLKTKAFSVEALIQHGYWKFQNLGTHRDTSEVEFQAAAAYKLRNFRLTDAFSLNLAGALGEWKNELNAVLRQARWDHTLRLVSSEALPDPFQRQYMGNNFRWQLQDLQTQGTTSVSYTIRNKSRFGWTGQVGWKQLRNTYFFINDTWRNDTLTDISLFSTSVRGTLTWKTLNWQPQVVLTSAPSNFSFIPQFDLRSKLFFNKKLFRARKLDFILGVDLRYQAAYRMLAYEPGLDLYRLPSQDVKHQPVLELDFFTGLQIDDFRFYFKFENIDYFWNPQRNLQQIGYPVVPAVLRLGLTWDFFN